MTEVAQEHIGDDVPLDTPELMVRGWAEAMNEKLAEAGMFPEAKEFIAAGEKLLRVGIANPALDARLVMAITSRASLALTMALGMVTGLTKSVPDKAKLN